MSYKHFLGSGHVLVGFYFTDQRSTVHPSGGSLTALLLLEPDEAVYLLVPEKTNGVCHGTPKSRACYDSFLITPLSRRLAQAWQTETSLSAQTFPNWHDPAIPKALWKYFQQLTSRACSHNMLIRRVLVFKSCRTHHLLLDFHGISLLLGTRRGTLAAPWALPGAAACMCVFHVLTHLPCLHLQSLFVWRVASHHLLSLPWFPGEPVPSGTKLILKRHCESYTG